MRYVKEHFVKPIPVLLQRLILHTSPRVVKIDGFDADVRVEVVLVEENRTAHKVGHMKSFLKNIMFDIIRGFLQGNNMPFHRNLFLESVFLSMPGPKVPVVKAEPLLHK